MEWKQVQKKDIVLRHGIDATKYIYWGNGDHIMDWKDGRFWLIPSIKLYRFDKKVLRELLVNFSSLWLFKWAFRAPFRLFSAFSSKHYNFYDK